MIRALIFIGIFTFAATLATAARCQDVSLQPNLGLQKPAENDRLQRFKLPSPPPEDSIVDDAANLYDAVPVHPGYDTRRKTVIFEFDRNW